MTSKERVMAALEHQEADRVPLDIGGSGSFMGPIIGSVLVLLVNETLRDLQDYQMLIYGIMMLAVIIAMPGGVYGVYEDVKKKIQDKKAMKKEGDVNA